MFRIGLLLIFAAGLSACASVRLTGGADGHSAGETVTHRYLGYVELVVPKAEKDIQAFKVQSAGIAFDDGLTIGWRDKQLVLVPLKENEDGTVPDEATCSLVVIVSSTAEARQVAVALEGLMGDEICKVNFNPQGSP
jgi:hypothetical protein